MADGGDRCRAGGDSGVVTRRSRPRPVNAVTRETPRDALLVVSCRHRVFATDGFWSHLKRSTFIDPRRHYILHFLLQDDARGTRLQGPFFEHYCHLVAARALAGAVPWALGLSASLCLHGIPRYDQQLFDRSVGLTEQQVNCLHQRFEFQLDRRCASTAIICRHLSRTTTKHLTAK